MPVLVETTSGAKCVVKWKGTGDGPLAIATDWICLHLARLAGIPVPTPHLIRITPDLATEGQDPEINELIVKSLGINLAVEFLEGAVPYKPDQLGLVDSDLKRRIYCFDVLLLNIDRIDFNPNIVFVEDRFVCLDFASALGIKMLMNGERYTERTLMPLIRRHPFYGTKESSAFPEFPVGQADLEEIIQTTPDEWLPDADSTKQKLLSGITAIFADARTILEHRLTLLDETPLETLEARSARMLANRKAFEAKWPL